MQFFKLVLTNLSQRRVSLYLILSNLKAALVFDNCDQALVYGVLFALGRVKEEVKWKGRYLS